MQIYGNPNFSDKFFVYLDDGSVVFVRDIETAKGYVQNPNYEKWYGKTLYCTNEDIVRAYDGKLYLRSKAPVDPNEIKIYDNKTLFVNNLKQYIEKILEDLSIKLGYESFYKLISWKDSKIKEYKQLAKSVIDYRDKLYILYAKCYEKYKNEIEDTTKISDLSMAYEEFTNNIPEFKESE